MGFIGFDSGTAREIIETKLKKAGRALPFLAKQMSLVLAADVG
jgi:hypothetical protein